MNDKEGQKKGHLLKGKEGMIWIYLDVARVARISTLSSTLWTSGDGAATSATGTTTTLTTSSFVGLLKNSSGRADWHGKNDDKNLTE